jgi:hypothetical protein
MGASGQRRGRCEKVWGREGREIMSMNELWTNIYWEHLIDYSMDIAIPIRNI